MTIRLPARDPYLGPLVLVAVLARILRGSASELINADAYFYIEAAARYAEGNWGEALRSNLHPLYPLALAAVRALVGDPWLAGAAVSVAAAGGALVALYGLAREGWGLHAARCTAFLFAIHPLYADWDGKVLTDSLYRCGALWALLLGFRALRDGSWRLGLGAGACLGAAYLTRSEGVLLPLLFFGVGGFLVLLRRSRAGAGALVVSGLALGIVAAPYLLWIRAEQGMWRPSPRGSVERAMQAGALKTFDDSEREARRREAYGLGPAAVLNVGIAVYRTYYVPALLLAAVGLAFFRRGAGGGLPGAFLGLLAAGNLAAVGLLYYLSITHISFRYVALPCLLLLPLAGRGLAMILEKLAPIPRAAPAFALLVALSLLPRIVLRGPDPDDRPLLEAAAWLRAEAPPRSRLSASGDPLAYHAGARYVYATTFDAVRARVDRREVDYLAFTEGDLDAMGAQTRELVFGAPGVRQVARFGPEGKGVRVYAVAGR